MFLISYIRTNKNNFLVLLFLSILVIALFSPIASSEYLPISPNYPAHIAAIIQARMGISAGQFPLRVTPWQYHGFQYPFYQFYSPFVYTIAGGVYKFLSPNNPFIAFKITIWLFMVLGGFYLYRLIKLITASEAAASLSAMVYLMAPYYLININVRGDLTESVAQGIVPIILYYMFFSFLRKGTLATYILLAIAWSFLILSHLVTFVYTSLFIFILFGFLFITDISKYKQLILLAITYLISLLLVAWFLVPIGYLHHYLNIASGLGNPFDNNWLIPLSTKLSAISPFSLLGNYLLPFKLYAAVGLPILLAVGTSLYNIMSKKPKRFMQNYNLLWPILITFFIALFTVWPENNFWKWLPNDLGAAQFSYSLLTQTMWLGAIIFSFAIVWLFQSSNTKSSFNSADQFEIKIEQKYIVILFLFIAVLSNGWLSPNTSNSLAVADVVNNPDLGSAAGKYLVSSKQTKLYDKYDKQQALLNSYNYGDGWLNFGETNIFSTELLKNNPQLTIVLKGNAPVDRKPLNLYVYINNQRLIYHINPGDYSLEIPIYKYIDLKQSTFSLSFGADNYFIPNEGDPSSSDTRKLAVSISEISFSGKGNRVYKPVDVVDRNCTHSPQANRVVCNLDSVAKLSTIQLPIFYYPQMLTIELNGQVVDDYYPTENKDGLFLATIDVPEGISHITAKFTGIEWANWVSAIIGILLICLFLVAIGIAYFNKRNNL